jgi:HlyD family secretion protein
MAAQLAVEKAQAALDTANYNLGNAIIIAPFDGVIAQVNVILGDFLSPANYATKIAIEIIDPSRIELDANVNEIDMPNVKLGQKVNIMLDALPNQQFGGTVYSIVPWPTVEGDVVSYEVKISVEMPEGSALQAGMSGEADIIIG